MDSSNPPTHDPDLTLRTAAVLIASGSASDYDIIKHAQSGQYLYASVLLIAPAALDRIRTEKGPMWPAGTTYESRVVLRDDVNRLVEQLAEQGAAHAAFRQSLCNLLRLSPDVSDTMIYETVLAELSRHDAPPAGQEQVRVLRLIEYVGPRDLVERQVKLSLHGTRGGIRRRPGDPEPMYGAANSPVEITAVTLHEYPEVLERARTRPVATVEDVYDHAGCTCTVGLPMDPDCPIHKVSPRSPAPAVERAGTDAAEPPPPAPTAAPLTEPTPVPAPTPVSTPNGPDDEIAF